jgi:signal transduction histidine kinase
MPDGKRSWFPFERLWQGSTLQWLGVIILPLALLVLAFALGSAWLHQHAMRQLVGERDKLAVGAAAGALNTEMRYYLSSLRELASRAEQGSLSIHPSTAGVASNFDLGWALYSSHGARLSAVGDLDWDSLESQPEIRSFLFNTPVAGHFTEWVLEEHPVILFSALSPDASMIAVGALSAEALVKPVITSVLPPEREAHIFLVSVKGRLIYESGVRTWETDLADHPGVSDALLGNNGTLYLRTKGIEQVVSYAVVPPLGWALVMEEPWEAVASPILETTQIAPLAVIPLLLITLAGLWFGARQIVRPLRELEKRSASLAWGDFDGIEQSVGGISEIRRLQVELIRMARKVQNAQRSLRDYIGVITEAQEEERRRLARELHDDTLQALIALKQRVQLVQKIANEAAIRQSMQELVSIAEQTIENLRRTTRALRPIYLEDLGLIPALEMLARETEMLSGIQVAFHKEGEERRLPSTVELALYRIAQEGLNNVARHARASHATLSIRFMPEHVEIQVVDDGIGFEVPKTPTDFSSSGHFGLLGMAERAELIGARLEMVSTMGKGSRLSVTWRS